MNNGQPEIYFGGRHLIMNPLISWDNIYSISDDKIQSGPMSIIRVPAGQIGLAYNNFEVELLLPGVHAKNEASFKFENCVKLDQEYINIGPIKIFTVKSGTARVCFDSGKVTIFNEGRYAVNSNTFLVANLVNVQQQNFKLNKHLVLLDGGVSMTVEGLLTFQVANVEKLIYQLGEDNLMRAIEDVTKAELARVFAALHFEQISSPAGSDDTNATPSGNPGAAVGANNIRVKICKKVVEYIAPIVSAWGVNIISFQLESTSLADAKYAAEYEQASLQTANAKSNLRAQENQNKIMLQSAQAQADSVRIQAEGNKQRLLVQAQAEAEGVKIKAAAAVEAAKSQAQAMVIQAKANAAQRIVEAESRNDAAQTMVNPYARTLAMSNQTVMFADVLKANVLTVSDGVGAQLLSSQFAVEASKKQ